MIKDCKVLLNNELVTVVRFGEKDIQIPSIRRNATVVRILYENGKYTVVVDDYMHSKHRKATKKTTKKGAVN